ncbi:MAG: 5-formyltetrahydrofolate cyclo-ligase [Myxococcales bacterium]|nr:5-formyltetrahydrofolate cyclo-ligase [Myxococcales bacterium]
MTTYHPLPMADVPGSLPIGKHNWRALARRLRRQSPPSRVHADALATAVHAFAVSNGAKLVALYHPIGAEVDTRPLANALLVSGISLAYPRLRGDGVTLDMVACTGPAALAPRPRSRLMEPIGPPLDPSAIDLVIVPALAVNSKRQRLGQGGGSYDRFLPQLAPQTAVMAVVPSGSCLPWGPADGHDIAVDLICTEDGIYA